MFLAVHSNESVRRTVVLLFHVEEKYGSIKKQIRKIVTEVVCP